MKKCVVVHMTVFAIARLASLQTMTLPQGFGAQMQFPYSAG